MRKVFFLFVASGFLLAGWGCHQNANTENQAKVPDQSNTKKEDSTAHKELRKNIVFFGNSLTAGLGVEASEAFPALVQVKLDSLKLPYQVINAGLSGETSAGGNNRIDWILQQPLSIFVLELGGNDGLRGIPLSETSKNLQSIIDKVKHKYPSAKIILAGMQIPPNMGKTYSSGFRTLFQQLAAKNKIYLIPFLLEGVGGVPELNQSDGIHPNIQGHKIVAENIWSVLKPLL
jgi:acyl-CoA thioesterase I